MGLTAAQKKLIENNPPEKVTVEAPTKPGRQPTATSAASALSTLSLPTPEQVRLGNVAGYMGAQLDKAASVPKSGTSVKPEGISGQEWAYRLRQQAQKQAQGRGGGEHSARTETSEKKQNVFGLIGGSVAGGGLKSAAGFVGAGGTLAKGADITGRNFTDRTMANQVNRVSEAMGRATLAARRGDMDAARSYSADAARSRAELQQMQEAQEAQALRSNTTPLAQTANKLDKTYENINDKANQTIARAQAGQSGLGKTASDVIVAGTQMLGDAPANLIVPGGSLMMMGARSFGDASQQARLNGANVGEQFGYGIGNAAVEVVSEKLFDGLAGLYGKGGADEVVEKVIDRLTKTDKGRSTLKVLSSMSGEALEKVFSGIVDPALESIYNGKDVRDNYSKETAAEIAYSALIGGILGGLGGSVDVSRNAQSVPGLPTPAEVYAQKIASPQILRQGAAQMVRAGTGIAPEETGANLGQKTGKENTTAINTNPNGHTATEQNIIEDYKNSVDGRLLNWINRVRQAFADGDTSATKMRLVLGTVKPNTADAVKAATGINVSGFEHMIDGSAVKHIEVRHGENGKANSTMNEPADLARVQYVLDNFDDCHLLVDAKGNPKMSSGFMDAHNKPAPMVQISKKVDGTYYVVEAVPDSATHKLHIVSAYMSKNNSSGSIIQALNMGNPPQLTPEAPLGPVASALINPTIPQASDSVKSVPPLRMCQVRVGKNSIQLRTLFLFPYSRSRQLSRISARDW